MAIILGTIVIAYLEAKLSKTSSDKLAYISSCLTQILENGPINTSVGICRNLDVLLCKHPEKSGIDAYDTVMYFAKNWKHHSGVITYPIKDVSNKKWEGNSGKFRKDLIRHVIKELDKYTKVADEK